MAGLWPGHPDETTPGRIRAATTTRNQMRITQGTFSFLPDLTDEQIARQIQYCIGNGWAVNIEFTDDPHPRNTYWEMWGFPMFDIKDAAAAMTELAACRKVIRRPLHPHLRLRLDPRLGIHQAFLHREPAQGRARLRSGAAGSGRPEHPLYDAALRNEQTRGPALLLARAACTPHIPSSGPFLLRPKGDMR